MLRRVTCFCKDYSVLCYISQLGDCLYVVYVLFFYKISLMLWWGLVTTATTEFDFIQLTFLSDIGQQQQLSVECRWTERTNIWIKYYSKHSEMSLTNLEMSTKCDILTGNACW